MGGRLEARTDEDLSRKSVFACHLGDGTGSESDISEHLEPPRSREQSELVRVVRQLHGAIGLAEWEGELATGTAVARVRVGGPLEVTHAPAVRRVVAAIFGAWLEILGNVVGYEDRHATHPAVLVRSSDGPS
jgi:hypothetical protein